MAAQYFKSRVVEVIVIYNPMHYYIYYRNASEFGRRQQELEKKSPDFHSFYTEPYLYRVEGADVRTRIQLDLELRTECDLKLRTKPDLRSVSVGDEEGGGGHESESLFFVLQLQQSNNLQGIDNCVIPNRYKGKLLILICEYCTQKIQTYLI